MVLRTTPGIFAPHRPEDDFVRIVHKKYTKLSEIKKELSKRLDDKIGQEVLVLEQSLGGLTSGCVISFPEISTSYKLGILTGKPILDECILKLPTPKSVEFDGRQIVFKKASIILEYPFNPFELDSEIVDYTSRDDSKGIIERVSPHSYAFRIFAGNEVAEHLRKTSHDRDYVKSLHWLGKEVPKDFKDKYDKNILDTKIKLIGNLEEVLDKIPRLQEDFEKSREKLRRERGYNDGDEWRSHEKSYIESGGGKYMMVDKAIKEAKNYLEDAIDLGMHEDDSEITYKRKGIRINQKEYITNLAKEFKIVI